MTIDLDAFKTNVYSQDGEDGVVSRILQEATISDGYFVEFGAWDGVYLSNTCLLAKNGWRGVFIEADPDRFRLLQQNQGAPSIDLVNARVGTSGSDTLEEILKTRTRFGHEHPAVLSIDIDSDDLAVWRSLRELRPFIVVIEYNPTIPGDVRFTNPLGGDIGNSALAIFEHARTIGYDLVAQTATNMIFVDGARRPATIAHADYLKEQSRYGIRFFFGYDGTLLRSAPNGKSARSTRADDLFMIPWGRAVFPQPLPAFARKRLRGSRFVSMTAIVLNAAAAVVLRPISTLRYALSHRAALGAYIRELRGTRW